MLKLLSWDYDARLQTCCVSARCDYEWFLKITQHVENTPDIQRNIFEKIDSKAYATLIADLKQGCFLSPPLVLAVNNVAMPEEFKSLHETIVDEQLEEEILLDLLTESIENSALENIYIIDGFQRSRAIKQISKELSEEALQKFLSNRLHLEIWLNIPFNALAYRMRLINAKHKPLSLKQQVEPLGIKFWVVASVVAVFCTFVGSINRFMVYPVQ